MWGFLVASRCIFILIMTLLGDRNTATTKTLDFKNSHLTSVGAIFKLVSRGGGDSKVENLCTGFRCFVACMLPVGVGKNETNPSRKENGQDGQ